MKEYRVPVSTSKMTVVLYAFLALLTGIALIPWLFPDNTLSGFMLGMFNASGAELPKAWVSPFTRLLGFTGSVLSLFPLFLGSIILLALVRNYAQGTVFSMENARCYSRMGKVFLLSALFLQPLSHVFFTLAASLNNPPGQKYIGISFTMENMTAIFLALVLILIGKVMQGGQKMAEEQALTV